MVLTILTEYMRTTYYLCTYHWTAITCDSICNKGLPCSSNLLNSTIYDCECVNSMESHFAQVGALTA